MIAHMDANGLLLSNKSDSGYKFVTTFFDGPLAGKFVAFADILGDERQHKNNQHGKRVPGFFGHKNVLALGVYDDVRDAAFVGQRFYGEDNASRNANVDALFEGNEAVVPMPPRDGWKHDADQPAMEAAAKRSAGRTTLDVQAALAKFHKENKDDYKLSSRDAKIIRKEMVKYLTTITKPKNADIMEAARVAFEPFKK